MAIALLQNGPVIGNAGSGTVTATLPSGSTAGNLLVAYVAGPAAGFVDAAPASWVKIESSQFACDLTLWYYPNCAGGLSSFVFTNTGGGTMDASVQEFSGAASAPLDTHANSSAASSTSSGSFAIGTPAVAGDLGITAFAVAQNNATLTKDAAWTELGHSPVLTGTESSAFNYKLSVGTSAVTSTETVAVAAIWDMVGATFKAAASAASGFFASVGKPGPRVPDNRFRQGGY